MGHLDAITPLLLRETTLRALIEGAPLHCFCVDYSRYYSPLFDGADLDAIGFTSRFGCIFNSTTPHTLVALLVNEPTPYIPGVGGLWGTQLMCCICGARAPDAIQHRPLAAELYLRRVQGPCRDSHLHATLCAILYRCTYGPTGALCTLCSTSLALHSGYHQCI